MRNCDFTKISRRLQTLQSKESFPSNEYSAEKKTFEIKARQIDCYQFANELRPDNDDGRILINRKHLRNIIEGLP